MEVIVTQKGGQNLPPFITNLYSIIEIAPSVNESLRSYKLEISLVDFFGAKNLVPYYISVNVKK